MTQKDRVLKYIDDFGSITVAEAITEIGVGSLTKCISNIRKDGIGIETRTVHHKNRYGQPTHHAEYRRV
jgi:hypothetical protein